MGSRVRDRMLTTAGELVVVFVGVMVALAVDAWWEGVQERADLDEYLSGVSTDLQGFGEGLDGVIEAEVQSQAELSGAISMLAADTPLSDTVIFEGFSSYSTFLPISTLDALLANADLGHLDPSLRNSLASYQAAMQSYRVAWEHDTERQTSLMEAAIRESDRLGALDGDPQARPAIAALRQSREFLGIARAYYIVKDNRIRGLRAMRGRVADLRDALNQYFGDDANSP